MKLNAEIVVVNLNIGLGVDYLRTVCSINRNPAKTLKTYMHHVSNTQNTKKYDSYVDPIFCPDMFDEGNSRIKQIKTDSYPRLKYRF